MIKIDKNACGNGGSLKGVVFYGNDVIGIVDNASSFLDMLCQIKENKEEGYRMEVDIEVSKGVKRTYVYTFTKDGRMVPSSYPGVNLWTDMLNKKLLYLYNFSISHNFKLSI